MTTDVQALIRAREAIATVAATHSVDCSCTTCRAAGGDEDAMIEVLDAVSELAEATGGGCR